MITDQQAENALDYLRVNASKAAKAKAERVYMEEYRKTVKSIEMQKHIEKPLAAQEREAYASEQYKAHLDAMKTAIENDEYNRWGMVAATATLDAWRTENANRRGEQKIG